MALHRQPPVQQGQQGRQDSPAIGDRDADVGQTRRKVELRVVRARPEVEGHGSGQHFRRRQQERSRADRSCPSCP